MTKIQQSTVLQTIWPQGELYFTMHPGRSLSPFAFALDIVNVMESILLFLYNLRTKNLYIFKCKMLKKRKTTFTFWGKGTFVQGVEGIASWSEKPKIFTT